MIVFDIEVLADLDVPLPALAGEVSEAERAARSRTFLNAWAEASAQKEADYLQGDDTARRKAWEA